MAPAPEELTRLVGAYASAVDARDLEALRQLFLPDATLTVMRGAAEPEAFRGHEGLAGVLAVLAPFELTLHEVSSATFEFDGGGEEATGECTVVAHHLRRNAEGEASNLVLHGRYADCFRRESGLWRFASRELRVLWTEKRTVRLT